MAQILWVADDLIEHG